MTQSSREELLATERELFGAATKVDVADAVKHIRNWMCYIDDRHRQSYADLIEAQAKLIAWLVEQRGVAQEQMPANIREALEFYADGKRYSGPNQRRVPGDKYTREDAAYMKDVTRDGGDLARRALSAVSSTHSNGAEKIDGGQS